jgi:acid phosphatase (class A)
MIAAVIGQMVPEKREELYARAADYGRSRMVAGVHFRSDVEADKVFGIEVAADEFANDNDFKTAFPDAKTCVRDALGLPTAP